MDTAGQLQKAFALIAGGLAEKEKMLREQPARYPYSRCLQHGINLFLAASAQAGGLGSAVFDYADEAAFVAHFLPKPILEWFQDWPEETVSELHLENEPFYHYGAFAYSCNRKYFPSSDCYEFLHLQGKDIAEELGNIVGEIDERRLFEAMPMEQDGYCAARKFIIEHPVASEKQRQEFLMGLAGNPSAGKLFELAYEEFPDNGYRCPTCGWTLTEGEYGWFCHSEHCLDIQPILENLEQIDGTKENLFRLKKGVMRYYAWPGKLELAIAKYCGRKGLECALWPEHDRYDAEIRFADGDVWEIDAKAYRNPVSLRWQIQNDGGFPAGAYTCGYYVIPTDYTKYQRNYTSVVNRALTAQPNVRCITLDELKRRISEKLREVREVRESAGGARK